MTRQVIGWLALGIGIIAVVLSAARAEQQLNALNFNAFDDWRTYAFAAHRWLEGEPIYAPIQVAGPYQLRDNLLIGFSYPPAAVPLFVPFAVGTAGLVAWISLNVGAFLLGLVAILRHELGDATPLVLGLTLLGLAAFPPFSNAVVSGNLNLGIAGLLAWSWPIGHHRVIAGAAGIGAVMKIFPAVFAAWPARRDGWRSILLAAATAALIAVASLPLVGIEAWSDFVAALRNAEPECSPQSLSIGCALDGLVGSDLARLAGIIVALLLVVLVIRARSPFVAYAALAGAMLAPVVDMHPHYWLLAWVVAFVGVVRLVGRRRRRT